MDARYKELLANLKTSTTGDKVIIDHAELRFFLYNVNELITAVKAEAVEDANNELNDLIRSRVGKDYAKFIENCFDEYAAKIRKGEL